MITYQNGRYRSANGDNYIVYNGIVFLITRTYYHNKTNAYSNEGIGRQVNYTLINSNEVPSLIFVKSISFKDLARRGLSKDKRIFGKQLKKEEAWINPWDGINRIDPCHLH